VIDINALQRLDGKVALVTGGSKGIGAGIAEHLLAAGAEVAVVARGADDLQRTVDDLSVYGRRVLGVTADVTSMEQSAAAISQCVDELGSLDILINNAAVMGPVGPLVEADMSAISDVVAANQIAPLAWIHAAYRSRMAEYGGTVLNISSFSGLRPQASYGAYGQAKAALNHQTRLLALELAPRVRVNAVAPGLVVTDFARASTTEEYRRRVAAQRPMQRLGESADIARAVLVLYSEASSWITGLVIPVDGGAMLAG
jgi:3-oxoacyl-[acyl-carrier protein] reductase